MAANKQIWLDGLHRTSLAPKVEKAAIYSASGDHVVVASPDFAPSHDEMSVLKVGLFQDPSQLRYGGFGWAGKKYWPLVIQDGWILGKAGEEGVVATKAQNFVLVGLFNERTQHTVEGAVSSLALYMRGDDTVPNFDA